MNEKEQKEQLRKELLAKLSVLDAEERVAREEFELQENYERWKIRKNVFMVGKAYLDIFGTGNLGISVTVPGNCSSTYKVGENLPSAVVTYYHNVITNELRSELQAELTKVVENFVEKSLKSPKSVLEMMALADGNLHKFPKSKVSEVKKELKAEQFKILDQFTELELADVAVSICHGKDILADYAKEKGYDLYASPVKKWLGDK